MAKIEYTQDKETGKYTSIVVDGKKARPCDLRGWNKAIAKTNYFCLLSETSRPDAYAFLHLYRILGKNTRLLFDKCATGKGENRFTGVTVDLNPLEATIYGWCLLWYILYENGYETQVPVQTFDDMKYFLLHLNSDAYMNLLD